jgi:hypothetical protein
MEPLYAIGLASNIIQFIDFASRITRNDIEIHQSTSLANEDAELIVEDLDRILSGLAISTQQDGVSPKLPERKQRLENLRQRSGELTKALLAKLNKLRREKGDNKRKTLVKVFKGAFDNVDIGAIKNNWQPCSRSLSSMY